MKPKDLDRLFEDALVAGKAREYSKAIELLTEYLGLCEDRPEALLYLGRAYHACGRLERAIGAFRLYLTSSPQDAAGAFFLGRAYVSAGNFREATRWLKRSDELRPGRPETKALLGYAYLKGHRFQAAVDCLQAAVELAPGDARIYRGYLNALLTRGVALVSRGENELGRQMLGFAIGNGADTVSARLWRARASEGLGAPDNALVDLEAAIAASGDVSLAWYRARLLFASGRAKEGLEVLSSLRRENPSIPEAAWDERSLMRYRALSLFNDGSYKEALRESVASLKLDGRDAQMHAIAAECDRLLGHWDKAIAHFSRAGEISRDPDFQLGIAACRFELGQYEAALAALGKAEALGAPAVECAYNRVIFKARLAEGSWRLVEEIRGLIRERGPDAKLLFALGTALFHAGRADLARGWLEKTLALVPGHELTMLYLVSALESTGDVPGALAAYRTYLDAYPDNGDVRKQYLDALVSGRLWKEACEEIERGERYEASGRQRLALKAHCLKETGAFEEAALLYRALLRSEPSDYRCLIGLADSLRAMGESSYAISLLSAARSRFPRNSDLLLVLGTLKARAGDLEGGVAAFRSCVEIDPDEARAYRNIAKLYARRGPADLAARYAHEAEEAMKRRAVAATKRA